MMSPPIDFLQIKAQRERRLIALAAAIREMHCEPGGDAETLFLLNELATECRCMPESEIEFDYRCAVAAFATEPGEIIDFSIDVDRFHQAALTAARLYVSEIEETYGSLFSGGVV